MVPTNVLHAFAGRLHQLHFCSFPEYPTGYDFTQHVVGADAHIGPLGTDEFAADFRENGAYCAGRCRHRPLQTFTKNEQGGQGRPPLQEFKIECKYAAPPANA